MNRNPSYHRGAAELAEQQGDWLTAIRCWADACTVAGAGLRGRLIQRSATAHEHAAALWNQRYPVGARVKYWPMAREGEGRQSVTGSVAYLLNNQAVVKIDGYAGCVALTHVEPLSAAPQGATEAG